MKGNKDYLADFIKKTILKLKVIIPQGTYLVWIDCSNLEISKDFVRINIACPKATLEEGFKRIVDFLLQSYKF